MKRFLLIALTSLVAVAGCHSFKKENVEPPTPLAKDFKSTLPVSRLWKNSVGDGAAESMLAAVGPSSLSMATFTPSSGSWPPRPTSRC